MTTNQTPPSNTFNQQTYSSNTGITHNTHQHYGHIHQHHLPHMHIYSTGMGTGYGHHEPQHHFMNQQPPTHVTMNINMNMYSNVMNINLQDNPNAQKTTSNNNISDAIKLDINDFAVKK
jgi:hypothetical protein